MADVQGETAVHKAARHGSGEVLRALLAQPGVAADECDGAGRRPIEIASQSGHETIVARLLDHGVPKRR